MPRAVQSIRGMHDIASNEPAALAGGVEAGDEKGVFLAYSEHMSLHGGRGRV